MPLHRKNGWILNKHINSQGQTVNVPAQTAITLFFQDNQISGNSGCNNYFADYRLDGLRLSIDSPGATMRACSDPIMQQEQLYLQQLQQVFSYQISADQLELIDQQNKALLFFTTIKSAHLSDQAWRLDSFYNGNGLFSNLITETITAMFDKDGKIHGFSGCNRYFGSYNSKQQQIEISALATTRKYCASPENTMQTEAQFIDMLGRAVSYAVSQQQLILFNAEGGRIVIFSKAE